MYTKRTYRAVDLAKWTRYQTFLFIGIGCVWVAAHRYLHLSWLEVPWTPLALIGTAVSFLIGFQNNSAYGRIWEARKIWGGIVNSSRTLGLYLQDMVVTGTALTAAQVQEEVRVLTYRHIAWLTALRHAMREPRPWELNRSLKTNQEWQIAPPEHDSDLETDLKPYLSAEDLSYVLDKGNKQTAIMYLQSSHLRELKDQGCIWEFSFLELEKILGDLVAQQGKSERIKNFPYPPQFATLIHYFMWLFVLLLPPTLVPQFGDIATTIGKESPGIGTWFVWASVPFYVAVAWVFHTMERIGRTGENPFEGTANDVPISTMARGIEIDLRQNLGEPKESIPEPFPTQVGVQF